MKQLLTFSRQDCFKTCRKKHWYAYEQAIRPVEDARALRMGTNWHRALELLTNSGFDAAITSIRAAYECIPEAFEAQLWEYERETLERLLCGYVWRWSDSGVIYIAKEHQFHLALVNPASGAASTTWRQAGKVDGVIRLEDGRAGIIEHKLFSEDLGPDSPLWKRLRVDSQISMYVNAERRMGHAIESVLYDVVRKPTIQPTPVPLLDGTGKKIVLDREGCRVQTKKGEWRQTADTEMGYVLQTRPMTAAEWGEKLIADIQDRPDFYFVRREISRLESDLAEFEAELWDIQQAIREAQLKGAHYRTVNKNTCAFCPYFELCTTGRDLSDLPPQFEKVKNLHPELELSNDLNPATAVAAACGHASAAEADAGPTAAQEWEWQPQQHQPAEAIF